MSSAIEIIKKRLRENHYAVLEILEYNQYYITATIRVQVE